jgi:glycosyltransferase involved in cell wall biosynthesis
MGNYSNVFSGHVLFVCSGNKNGVCTPAITQQANALEKRGVKISFFKVRRKGIVGYLRGAIELKKWLKNNKYDLIHAHYGLSGIMATLAGAKPLVVSLMGSDVFGAEWIFRLVAFFAKSVWPVTIVKSEAMARKIGGARTLVIPNGVDMDLFREMSKAEARRKCGFSKPRVVLWPADPARKVKNYELAEATMQCLGRDDVGLETVFGVETFKMPDYYNAANAVLVTSRWEGSPNVVKEALACNVPVVSTPVGDVEDRIKDLDNCSVCLPSPKLLAKALEKAIDSDVRPDGRNKIKELDNNIVVRKILTLYSKIV